MSLLNQARETRDVGDSGVQKIRSASSLYLSAPVAGWVASPPCPNPKHTVEVFHQLPGSLVYFLIYFRSLQASLCRAPGGSSQVKQLKTETIKTNHANKPRQVNKQRTSTAAHKANRADIDKASHHP